MTNRYLHKKHSRQAVNILFLVVVALVLATACKMPSSEEMDTTMPVASDGDTVDMNHAEDTHIDMEAGADHDHEAESRQFVANAGAEVHITSPTLEATFKSTDSVLVTIETTGFKIGEDGNHWHIYLDGDPIMVMGGNTFVLQNLSAGQHDIDVYLSNGNHEDLEQGDTVTIMVEE